MSLGPFFISEIKVSYDRIQNKNKIRESIVNILVDSRYKSIVSILDKDSNIIVVDVNDLGLSSNDVEGLDPVVEMMYTKCVDKNIGVVITTEGIGRRLKDLGIKDVRCIGVDNE